jgi:peptidyl-prolyl cis-trans isomerase D
VETEAGTHLLLVTAREDAELPPLEEMRPELEARVQQQEAAVELLRTVEALRDISFNADDLATPAAELGLELATAQGITRDQSEGLFANDSLLQAAWAEDVLHAGHNSDVIEIAEGRYVALRVEAVHEPRQLTFAEVRDDVLARVIEERTQEALDAAAEELLAQLRDGRSMESLANERGFQWQVELGADRRNANVPFEVLNKSFELPDSAIDRVYGTNGDVMLVEVVRVAAGDYESLDSAEQRQMQRQTMLEYGAMVNTDYERSLRDSAEIETVL